MEIKIGSPAPQAQPSKALKDPVSLIDTSFYITGGAPCLSTNASLWVQNAYSSGCSRVVVSGNKVVVNSTSQRHVLELALGRQDWAGTDGSYKYGFPSIIDGKRTEEIVVSTDNDLPPSDLVSRHHWGNEAPDWQSEGAVNALKLG